jgi:ABC-2 type transport system permease protein
MSALANPAAPGFALRAVATEAGKGLRLLWRRRAVTITAIVLNGLMYLLIQSFIGGGHLMLPVLALTLPGLFAYVVAAAAALAGSGGIAEEVNGGTLEQVHLSPARPSLLVAGRLAALAAEGLIPAVVLALAFGWPGGRTG